MKEMKTLTIGGQTYEIVDGNAVHFDGTQTLTPEQQAQARENIGAVTTAEVASLIEERISSITNAEEVAY